MSNLNYWISKVGFSLINRLIVFVFGFANYFLMVRHLSKSEFGIYSIYLVIVMIAELAISSFVQNGFIKFYIDKSNKKEEVIVTSFILNILLTLFFSLIIFFSSDLIANIYGYPELSIMLKISCLSAFAIIPYAQINYFLSAEINFKLIAILSFIRFGSFFIGVLIVFFNFPDFSQVDFVWLQFGSILLGSLFSLYILLKVKLNVKSFSRQVFHKIFHFGKYVFGVGLTSMLTTSVDKLMIGYFISSEAVASYGIAGKFMNFIEVPISSISHVLYPKFAESVNGENPKKEIAKTYEYSVGTMLAIILPFTLILLVFPSFFITIAAGDKYLDAVPIVQILITFNILKPFATQAGSVLEISGKPKIGFYALLISTIINVVLNYYLIRMSGPFGGTIGAVLASMISSLFFLTVVIRAIRKECDASIILIFKHMLSTYVIAFGLAKNQLTKFKHAKN